MSQPVRKRRLSRLLEAAAKKAKVQRAPLFAVSLTAMQAHVQLLWVRSHSWLYTRLCSNALREVCSYIKDPLVIEMWEDLVGFFDTKTQKWEKYASLEEDGLNCSYASYVRLDVNRVFVSGILRGADLRSLSYIFHHEASGFALEKMPQLRVSRQMAGLLHFRDSVYIFGGLRVKRGAALSVTSFLRSAECLTLSEGTQWRKLADRMSCRRLRITPCEYRCKVYLCGGYPRYDKSMTCIEVFSLLSERYEDPLYVPLPLEVSVVSFIVDGELFLVANAVVARHNLKDALAVCKLERQPNLSSCAARGSPIICGEYIYWTYAKACTRVKFTETPMQVEKFEMVSGVKSKRPSIIIIV